MDGDEEYDMRQRLVCNDGVMKESYRIIIVLILRMNKKDQS